VLSGSDGPVAADLEPLSTEEVVAVGRFTIDHVQRPFSEPAALRDEHTGRCGVSDLDLGGDRVGLVLEVEQRSWRL
jgi:hypothetical protein